ncbi:RES family NAD+ phosphorylase [Paenibacillus glucanolyticus]|jgi:hypothetical protein|uniref:RES domain-containing protein n=1 Tax=Paenibacillus glucanolyticus TaxID=59843 RepID=A0A163GT84_9BACL|nr:RES family NAD+ phosphorylase [Paenibacillus glucanolyticus]KZS45137.1 hypothetical protein AWU65_03910 [Paenibacillus glucanolyticus]OMF65139.1 hypothetical protein BK142_31140 [Paenibacillus glucanolyticus]
MNDDKRQDKEQKSGDINHSEKPAGRKVKNSLTEIRSSDPLKRLTSVLQKEYDLREKTSSLFDSKAIKALKESPASRVARTMADQERLYRYTDHISAFDSIKASMFHQPKGLQNDLSYLLDNRALKALEESPAARISRSFMDQEKNLYSYTAQNSALDSLKKSLFYRPEGIEKWIPTSSYSQMFNSSALDMVRPIAEPFKLPTSSLDRLLPRQEFMDIFKTSPLNIHQGPLKSISRFLPKTSDLISEPFITTGLIDYATHVNSLANTYLYEPNFSDSPDEDSSIIDLDPTSDSIETKIELEQMPSALGLTDIMEITRDEMVKFVGFLQRYPMLGLEEPVGKIIRESVCDLAVEAEIEETLYRCRVRENNELMPWTETEMWEAPMGVSSQGRFNVGGNGFFYLSQTSDVAIREMKQEKGKTYDIVQFRLSAKIKLIDLTMYSCPLFDMCMYPASNNNKVVKEYLVPNFLSQCCQREGIHAIKYKSMFNSDVENFVFFDKLRSWFYYLSSETVIR